MPIFPSPAQSEASRLNGGRSGGRPPRKEAASRTSVLVRLSPSELDEIDSQVVVSSAKNRSDFIRSAALGKRILSREDQGLFLKLKDIEQEMLRQGGAFALAARNNQVSGADLNARLLKHNALLEKLDQLLEQVSVNVARRGKSG